MKEIKLTDILAEDTLRSIIQTQCVEGTLELIERVYAKNKKAKEYLINIFKERF